MRTNELCVVLMPQHITAFSIQATINKTTVFFYNNTQETYNKGFELLVQNFVDVPIISIQVNSIINGDKAYNFIDVKVEGDVSVEEYIQSILYYDIENLDSILIAINNNTYSDYVGIYTYDEIVSSVLSRVLVFQ